MPFGSILDPLFAILQVIGLLLFRFQLWIVVVAVIAYLTYQNRRRVKWVNEVETILLRIDVPRDNEKKELSAEQMFASLHGILRSKVELQKEGALQEHISFEIVSRENSIQFYVWCPKHLKDFVESQIYSQYPTVQIAENPDDYTKSDLGNRVISGSELVLQKNDVLPIQTFVSFEVDPLAAITGVLATLENNGEEAWIQVLARPVDDAWQEKSKRYIDKIKNGGSDKGIVAMLQEIFLGLPLYIISNFGKALTTPPGDAKAGDTKKPEPSTGQQTAIKAVEEKMNKLGYEVKIRLAYLGPDEATARMRMQSLVGGFKVFNSTNLNGFAQGKTYNSEEFLDDYRSRLFIESGQILNIEELASLYHLPHKSVETPSMVWTTSKTSEPPSSLPVEGTSDAEDISLFGLTNFRGRQLKFGIKRRDRGRHMYIIGQTGAGKSFLLNLLTLSDIYQNQGFAIIDPHGDYATDMMRYIPEDRIKDVVYFDATDREHPMAFNPMEVTDPNLKNHISSELVGVLKRMFENSWGPRLEYILRYTILALLDYPDATMLDITRMLTEKDFRKGVIKEIDDPVVRNFWVTEFASWNEKFASEAIAPVLNKVGAFVANPLIRNIVGQKKSAFNIRKLMDEGKILIVNLSRGQVGEDNAAILGALMVTKIQLAAMGRADMAMEDRKPFYLYVDEFQNFATDSFAVILSEARKYGLNLTVANQYVAQMPETVRDAVFGNVGTIVSFRVGPGDAVILGKYFEPTFEPADITRLNNQNIFISMIVNGEKSIPFSATTLRRPDPEDDLFDKIVINSRHAYASDRAEVEADIRSRTEDGPSIGDRAVEAVVSTSGPAISSNMPAGDQKPYTPKSEFLAALKNPDGNNPAPVNERAGERRPDYSGERRPEQPAAKRYAYKPRDPEQGSNQTPAPATTTSDTRPRDGQGSQRVIAPAPRNDSAIRDAIAAAMQAKTESQPAAGVAAAPLDSSQSPVADQR